MMDAKKASEQFVLLYTIWIAVLFLTILFVEFGSRVQLVVCAFTLLWIFSGIMLAYRKKICWWYASVILVGVAWMLPAYQTAREIAWVIQHQAFDNENSSPMAFFLGASVEQICFFIPLSALLVLGIMVLKNERTKS